MHIIRNHKCNFGIPTFTIIKFLCRVKEREKEREIYKIAAKSSDYV